MAHRTVTLCALIALSCLAAAPASTQPEIRRGQLMGGSPAERSKRYFDRLVALAEPTGHADAARLASYLAVLKHDLVHDARLIAFSPAAELRSDTVVLTGFAEYPELRDTAVKFLHVLGFPRVADRMELLPSSNLEGKPFAIATAGKAFLYDKPQSPHESLTQALKGEALFLLKKDGDFYLCHSAEGYVGYVAAADVRVVDEAAMTAALGETTDVHAARERIDAIIAHGKQYLGTPYVWGGRTTDGIDCSGLTHVSFESQGVVLPRDADQQALCGTLVATRSFRAALRRGDLLFFISSRGSIHHVAIYLGDDQFLEAATPVAKISSFNPKDKNYEAKRDKSFAFAKRVLN
jgi:cell wall-associated NlpC family hydrolase